MRRIYSQSIDTHANQTALGYLAKSLGIAQSRILERIIESIELDDLVAIATQQISLKTTKTIQIDQTTAQVIQDEIARSISLLSARVADAANDGAKIGVLSLLNFEERL